MKIRIGLITLFCIILGASAVFAQEKAVNFAGHWELDVSKSKLPERNRVESMTMIVTQTEKDLTVETKAKRGESANENPGRGNGARRGGMGRGMMLGGDAAFTYTLDGKETSAASAATMGEAKLKAEITKDGKLKLTQTRNIETQMGSRSLKLSETWELSGDGKTLKVKRETETPRGTQNSELHFSKH